MIFDSLSDCSISKAYFDFARKTFEVDLESMISRYLKYKYYFGK